MKFTAADFTLRHIMFRVLYKAGLTYVYREGNSHLVCECSASFFFGVLHGVFVLENWRVADAVNRANLFGTLK
jgi:hypothetical protein